MDDWGAVQKGTICVHTEQLVVCTEVTNEGPLFATITYPWRLDRAPAHREPWAPRMCKNYHIISVQLLQKIASTYGIDEGPLVIGAWSSRGVTVSGADGHEQITFSEIAKAAEKDTAEQPPGIKVSDIVLGGIYVGNLEGFMQFMVVVPSITDDSTKVRFMHGMLLAKNLLQSSMTMSLHDFTAHVQRRIHLPNPDELLSNGCYLHRATIEQSGTGIVLETISPNDEQQTFTLSWEQLPYWYEQMTEHRRKVEEGEQQSIADMCQSIEMNTEAVRALFENNRLLSGCFNMQRITEAKKQRRRNIRHSIDV